MLHAFSYVIFILIFTMWLGAQVDRTYSLKSHWKWILAAFIMGVFGTVIGGIVDGKPGNFILHASGGAASVLLYIYLANTLKLRFKWQLTTVLIFAFVSMLGVLNELAEYALELLGFGIFSFDTHDPWRDFTANTTGAAVVWLVYTLWVRISKRITS